MVSAWFTESVSPTWQSAWSVVFLMFVLELHNTPLKKLENFWVSPWSKIGPVCTYETETEEITLILCYKCSKLRTSVTFLSGYFGFTLFSILYFTKSLITFSSYFACDMRFLRRPQYGEYKYLPKSLWLNVVLVSVYFAPNSGNFMSVMRLV